MTSISTEQSTEIGKAARAAVPRSSLGEWNPIPDRDSAANLLSAQEANRVQELVPLRHERMMSSSFAFYRGSAIIQAADLATTPHTGLMVQLCGDAHLANFGGFAAPDRDLVFDLNDFDETHPGPFEWDLKRLAVSFELAVRGSDHDPSLGEELARHVARTYRDAMAEFATMRVLDVWYSRLDSAGLYERLKNDLSTEQLERFERAVKQAQKKDSLRALSKLTEDSPNGLRIKSDAPLIVPVRDLPHGAVHGGAKGWMEDLLDRYMETLEPYRRRLVRRYRVVDAARKVVGVGSVGTRSWIVFMVGRDEEDPLFLQVKEANESVLEAHTEASRFSSHGERVVNGQRILQSTGDILLGWFKARDLEGVERHYYVRQLWDGKLSPDYETMAPKGLEVFADVCARILARGHARSGDPVAIAAYLGNSDGFDQAIGRYAVSYADQNDLDFATMEGRWADGS